MEQRREAIEIIRIRDVCRMTGLSRTTLWRRVNSGQFPKPLRLGGPQARAVGWVRGAVEEWLGSRPTVDGDGDGDRFV